MKRVQTITKPTGRKPMRIGAILLKEVPYQNEWRIQATWRDPDRKKKWFNNWRHAEEFAAKTNKRLDELKEKGAGRYTFNDAADSFLKRCEQRANAKDSTLTLDTLGVYRHKIEKVLRPKFGHLRLKAITSRDVEDWMNEQGEKYSSHTMSGRLVHFRTILDYAVARDMLPTNPLRVKKLTLPSRAYKKRVYIPDSSDLDKLREYLNDARPLYNGRLKWSCLRVLAVLGASCGMRAGEVAGLRWDSIDRNTGDIDIKEAIAEKAGRKGPKTEAGYRKVPTTLRARQIIEEHAEIYKHLEGKCVGSVLKVQGSDHLRPQMVSVWFTELMHECGLVRPGKKPGSTVAKFTFHALRHWCASHWMKSIGDVHQVAQWLGHKHASMTLDIYGHCLDDPEAREKFQRMPDWLDPVVELDAPVRHRPIQITEPLALPAPKEESSLINGEQERDFQIDVPDIAKPWLKPFIDMLLDGILLHEAYRLILPQLPPSVTSTGKIRRFERVSAKDDVCAELKRLKMPMPKQIAVRVREERIMRLHAQKHQVLDIARMLNCSKSIVRLALNSRHKPNANNPLNRKIFIPTPKGRKPQPEHKTQLKLL